MLEIIRKCSTYKRVNRIAIGIGPSLLPEPVSLNNDWLFVIVKFLSTSKLFMIAWVLGKLFFSTSVPLASIIWVRLTFSSLCSLYSKQCSQLIPATLKNSQEKNGIESGAAG